MFSHIRHKMRSSQHARHERVLTPDGGNSYSKSQEAGYTSQRENSYYLPPVKYYHHLFGYSHRLYFYGYPFSLLSYSLCSNKGMEHLYSIKCKNKVPLYDLLLEMLDAHWIHSPGKVAQAWGQAKGEPLSTKGSSIGPKQGNQDTQLRSPGPGVLEYGTTRSDWSPIP